MSHFVLLIGLVTSKDTSDSPLLLRFSILQKECYTNINSSPINELVFPASILHKSDITQTNIENQIIIMDPKDFKLNFIPKELQNDSVVTCYFYSHKNLILNFCINKINSFLKNNVILEFSKENFIQGDISNKGLIDILINNIDVFKIQRGEVVHRTSNLDEPKWKINISRKINAKVYPEWITFLGKEICDFVGHNHLLALDGCAEIREIDGGILFVFQEEPFDPENSAHIKHRDYILEQLNAIPLPPT